MLNLPATLATRRQLDASAECNGGGNHTNQDSLGRRATCISAAQEGLRDDVLDLDVSCFSMLTLPGGVMRNRTFRRENR